jgi:hypothetical protein
MESENQGFNFRWGVPVLDDRHYGEVPGFILRNYSEAGVTVVEMMVVIHLSAYRFDTPTGAAKPSLTTIAEQMGYNNDRQVRRIVSNLKRKKMLKVIQHNGKTSEYVFTGLSRACKLLDDQKHIEADETPGENDTPVKKYRGRRRII